MVRKQTVKKEEEPKSTAQSGQAFVPAGWTDWSGPEWTVTAAAVQAAPFEALTVAFAAYFVVR
jgi:hypothetical protein